MTIDALTSSQSTTARFFMDEEQARRFYSLSRSLTNPLDEQLQFHHILERLKASGNATLGALVVFEEERKRFVFRAAFGLSCLESAVCNLVWSYGKKLLARREGLMQVVVFSAEELSAHRDFTFEKMLGFKTLCYQPLVVDDRMLGAVLLGNRNNNVNFYKRDLFRLANAAQIAGSELERIRLYRELKGMFINSVRAFVSAIDAKDAYTHGHSERVTGYAVKIAKALGWKGEQLDTLQMSAILHDVGKIGVPEAILSKPASLTAEEFTLIMRHPEIGARIIGEIPQLKHTLSGILFHHERYDGKGYPKKLSGADIPVLGRLIAVADAYDAMTSDRPYRKGLKTEQALQELVTHSGKQFDPEFVSAFISAYERGAIT